RDADAGRPARRPRGRHRRRAGGASAFLGQRTLPERFGSWNLPPRQHRCRQARPTRAAWAFRQLIAPFQKKKGDASRHLPCAGPSTAGKNLIDSRHEAVRRLTSVRTRLGNYWRGLTLPYTEPGMRLIRQADVESFTHTMEGFREELAGAENGLAAAYDDIKDD